MKRADFRLEKEYDIIIIGGGITGSAVAYDASLRGLSVALLEKDDFGAKTSAATSKLIHGGLRYLANFELGLVRESLKERRILENIAPNFVYPIPNMILTGNATMTNKKFVLKIGMILYDILSFDKFFTWDKSKRLPCHKALSIDKTITAEPNTAREGLTGSIVYYDCASLYPERLTLAFIKSAMTNGAEAANYMEVTGFINENDSVTGIKARDLIKKKNTSIKGRVIINCAGPWADHILTLAPGHSHGEIMRRSEGIHIITKKLVNNHLVSAMTPSGRHIFIIPWRNHSLIGTTDKEYIGSPDDWKITKQSIEELIHEVNQSFGPGLNVKYEDVLFSYGGLRPLVEDQTEDVYESSRKYEIFDHSADGLRGLITVEGGKYTTSRNLAENVMKLVCKILGVTETKCDTKNHYLSGSDIEDMEEFIQQNLLKYGGYDRHSMDYLARIYGTEINELMNLAAKHKSIPSHVTREILAQTEYAVKNEMAFTLADVLFRRTGIGSLGHPGKKTLNEIATYAGKLLRWNSKRLKQEVAEAEKIFKIPS
ncbi:MAG TPA: glycerol-3-phosphate dehydrogenase/oxidase [Spirochaetota bacterium]|nr:glycerol-3-phosphate dehydrogenase/oxidase [Spirochaetota bacterium]